MPVWATLIHLALNFDLFDLDNIFDCLWGEQCIFYYCLQVTELSSPSHFNLSQAVPACLMNKMLGTIQHLTHICMLLSISNTLIFSGNTKYSRNSSRIDSGQKLFWSRSQTHSCSASLRPKNHARSFILSQRNSCTLANGLKANL